MNSQRPTDAWGDLLSVELTEEQETLYDDGFDAGYEAGWKEAILQCVTQLLPLAVLDEVEEEENEL